MSVQAEKEIVVMHCFTYVYDGGQETFIVKTFKYIEQNSEKKFRFIICSLVDINNPVLVDEYAKKKIKLYGLKFTNRNSRVSDVFRNVKELFKLSRIIRKEKVDILYGHDFFSALTVRICYMINLLFFYRSRRLYISLHNLLFWLKRIHHVINRILSIVTDRIVCVSRSVYQFSIEKDRINPNKYEIIYNGIDVNEFVYDDLLRAQIRKEYGISHNSLVLGNIGSLSFRKGQMYLIEAFSKFILTNPDSYLLIFGGSRKIDGDLEIRNEIYDKIRSCGLEERVLICSPRLDINKVYSMFDIFVMPSVVEGFGLVLAEAMSCECLVIASDIPPFREIITPNINGFFFKSEDSEDLLKKLEHVHSLERSVSKTIREEARKEIVTRFNSVVMGQKYASLYEM